MCFYFHQYLVKKHKLIFYQWCISCFSEIKDVVLFLSIPPPSIKLFFMTVHARATKGNTVTFPVTKINVGGGYDHTTGVFTCPSDGYYTSSTGASPLLTATSAVPRQSSRTEMKWLGTRSVVIRLLFIWTEMTELGSKPLQTAQLFLITHHSLDLNWYKMVANP